MRVFLLVIGFIFCSSTTFAQEKTADAEAPKCKLEIDKVDKFTADVTQLTRPERIWRDFYEEKFVQCAAVRKNDQRGLLFENYTDVEYRIEENDSLMFLLSNDTIVTLKASTERLAERFNDKTYFAKVFYSIDIHEMALLMNNKVKAIRQYHKGGFFEIELKEKKQDDILSMLSCVH